VAKVVKRRKTKLGRIDLRIKRSDILKSRTILLTAKSDNFGFGKYLIIVLIPKIVIMCGIWGINFGPKLRDVFYGRPLMSKH